MDITYVRNTMKGNFTRLSPDLYFSHSQFFLFDNSLESPACDWTEEHSRQGFARRSSSIAVGTLLEFGSAIVNVEFGAPDSFKDYERVIAVPFEMVSGELSINGPDEYPLRRTYSVPRGSYRVIVAQRVVANDREEINISLESLTKPLARSAIIVADAQLSPPDDLVETADEPHSDR